MPTRTSKIEPTKWLFSARQLKPEAGSAASPEPGKERLWQTSASVTTSSVRVITAENILPPTQVATGNSPLLKLQNPFTEARELIQGSVCSTLIMLQSSARQMIGVKVDDVSEVCDCGPQQTDTLTNFLTGFGNHWLKNIRTAGHEVTVMAISPARLLSSVSDSLPETDRL